ncbi:MAG: bifunctional oligoribonuclease/PAP phosphatase NrnA [Bacteroidia bacterium]|nr:bifunctional oligoribonuclease/PAP phosphatase NrnA [Bacteroidia bacterium]MBT8278392.1 bifunctional oligoribonuclease/PAP phosphatase NrnA [Bacteroidia bacterium]NND26378.1 bifunctional oligoribonuclease/PAP phosphatase NrnA [Flavobacteriaceae bacterium]NNK59153.1 bifunctional oligoribonuclease/PAP phosphatase NrnA [Flavobacteriaceae bacterium]RZW50540.1 MAG: bifunctional oligoribonuclease/PAP phosphatase NrnA [Flavobacteriaceae bacterium]
MTKNDILEIKQLLNAPRNIVIVPHKNPDGDAMGSSLALYHYLKGLGHQTKVIVPNDYPSFLKWLPGDRTVLIYEGSVDMANTAIADADIIFTLDFNALNRTGAMEPALKSASAVKILIDHHQQPENYAKYIYSDVSMSSTCEMIYHFLVMLDAVLSIDAKIASCLYVGIMTDTGSFRFSSTTSTTHRVVADLIDKGAKNTVIHNKVYDNNSHNRLKLLGCALNNLKVLKDYNTAYITLSQEELNAFKFKKGDTEGVVNYALSVKDVQFAVIFIEHKIESLVKISFRSNSAFDVNQFARKHFNGGGHINAAGGRSEMSLNDTIEKFISILPQYKNDLKS